jgi:predicted AAA+ superfamily ATPase
LSVAAWVAAARGIATTSRLRSNETSATSPDVAASHTATLLNVADLAGPFELTRQTIHDYVTLLERVFLIDRLPAWHTNHLARFVKRAKLHMGDTGVACALLGLDAPALDRDRTAIGSLLETFVLQELRRQASGRPSPVDFFHFRDRDDFEVDIVMERGHGAVAGVEVKAAATVTERDLRGLRKLRAAAGSRFTAGVVLYDGSATIKFDDNLFAVPLRSLWEAP